MIDNKVFSSVKPEENMAPGLKMIGEALPELAAEDPDDVTDLDQTHPAGLPGAVAAFVRDEPVKALLWAAGIGIAFALLTSK